MSIGLTGVSLCGVPTCQERTYRPAWIQRKGQFIDLCEEHLQVPFERLDFRPKYLGPSGPVTSVAKHAYRGPYKKSDRKSY